MDTLIIGLCQIRNGYDFEENLSKALLMIDKAVEEGAEIAVLPEMFITPYEPDSIRKAASLSSEALDRIRERATKDGIIVVAGSMPCEGDGKRFFNRSFVIGKTGQIIHQHDKIHLFDCSPPGGPRVRESETIRPGSAVGTFDTHWGTASVLVCYDIRFTPLTQVLADRGVRLLFVPAAFSLSTGRAHWEMLMRIRAVEIQGFVIGVQPAYNDSLKYVPYGHSMVASPWGEIIADAGNEETVKVVSLDLKHIEIIRQTFPLLAHRRKDLYDTCWLVKSND